MLREYYGLPEGFIGAGPGELARLLGGPSLIHLDGRRDEALFVSVLLHGNETTGLHAVQSLLASRDGRELPRALSLLVGNVEAAAANRRLLRGQMDYNRVWRGGDAPEHLMAADILQRLERRRLFASVDVHNNTGHNPHYAIVTRLESRHLQLASLFSRIAVWAARPDTTLTVAMGERCPAVTLECGRPGEPRGVEHAAEYIEACLNLSEIPAGPVPGHDLDLYRLVAVARIGGGATVAVEEPGADLVLPAALDRLNFREVPPGTLLAHVSPAGAAALGVWDDEGADVRLRYLEFADGAVRTRRPLVPAMLTLDPEILKQDCLCYLMERVPAAVDDAVAERPPAEKEP